MKHSKLLFALLALTVLGNFTPANAATGSAALSFTRPTQYTDNSALPATDITGYAVDCTFTPTGGVAAPCTISPATLPGSVQSGAVSVTYPAKGGEACFKLRTLVGTVSSAGSQPATCRTLAPITPNDPTNLTITVTLALTISSDTPIRVAVAEPVISRN